MLKKPHGLAALAAAAATAAVLAGCSGTSGDGFGSPSEDEDVARFVQQPWADLVVETEIAAQVLRQLGYETTIQEVSVPLAAEALSSGVADAYLGNWWPSQQTVFESSLSDGTVTVAGTLLTGTQYAPAVPAYVTQQLGVRSLADLDEHADAFERQILGIEPGTPGNQYILDAIEADAYGLGDWELVESSTEAMLTEVTRRVAENQPVVFLGWSPHWMTVEWDLNFLEDPQEVWPGAGEIRVLARGELEEQDPNLYRFLSQIQVDSAMASEWIYGFDKDGKTAETLAAEWIASHPDVLRSWLDGVTDTNGEPAADVVLADAAQ